MTRLSPIVGKAILYTGCGGSDVVTLGERAVRPPEAGEIRLKVVAAAVNPTDILLRERGSDALRPPLTPGMDAAGIVESVGSGVTRLTVGDEVMAAVLPTRAEGGAQAEYIVIPAASAVLKPGKASFGETATLPMNGLTALYALSLAELSKGQTLVVTGGAGWLAHFAIAFAKSNGLTVIADASPSDFDLVQGYGADIVVERGSYFFASVKQEKPEGVDAILDTALLGETSFETIKPGGIYIPVRGWNGPPTDRGVQIKPVRVPEVLERTDWLETIGSAVKAGAIKGRVAAAYSPAQISEAQQSLAAGGVRGRPVLVFT
ncbi:NADP-dependent oxidoreductase [Sphingobium sp. EP60837]|uniref:NADP-dependent oxidoreductase n=1 Tax=Sphingobium sp. EP60837 TaxID=1855519 RepID=UPI0007DE1E47|nr:NADP-dependent oxidoreductase [Sphingobium sp. EP60837]ANI80121.1 NADPH:quinone reductase [Sphingobium sp. EP60837]